MKKRIKLNKYTQRKIDKSIGKIIKDYGCVFLALQFDDEEFIKNCELTGHKKYHNPKVAYNLELNY